MAEEDLIFGKNRHFFGGVEPSNMLAFSVVPEYGVVTINATLPNDTIVNGQTICTVKGAVIRRKVSGFPTNEFDGDLVANITGSTSFIDTEVSATDTYYYAAFPYTTQEVYNRNKANRAVLNGVKPMVIFAAKSVYVSDTDTITVEITATLPSGAEGAVIRKSQFGYPIDVTDGEEFLTITSNGVYTDTNVILSSTYYYTAFPYTSTGAYGYSESNYASVITRKRNYYFGYDLVNSISSPSNRVSYPKDVDNADFTPAKMNFTTSIFDYGSWNFAPGKYFMPRPCMLTNAGTVDHYLDPNDYTKREDGSTASSVADTSFGGNAMMEWPKIYTKRWEEDGVYHFRCTDDPMDDVEYECWSNYDRNNNKIKHFYTPIYCHSKVSNSVRSLSGQSSTSGVGTAARAVSSAMTNGDDWYVEVLADILLIQDLLVLMAKTTDGQTAFGYGRCSKSIDSPIASGTMDTKGMFWGDDDQTSGVKVFGMENLWGNKYRQIAGFINDNGIYKVKLTRGTHDGSTATDYNTDGSRYLTIEYDTSSITSDAYINKMLTTPYGRFPVGTGGSASTFEADSILINNGQINYAYIGGIFGITGGGLMDGPFFINLKLSPDRSSSEYVAALSCKPLATT